jgi:hypothetical protein
MMSLRRFSFTFGLPVPFQGFQRMAATRDKVNQLNGYRDGPDFSREAAQEASQALAIEASLR